MPLPWAPLSSLRRPDYGGRKTERIPTRVAKSYCCLSTVTNSSKPNSIMATCSKSAVPSKPVGFVLRQQFRGSWADGWRRVMRRQPSRKIRPPQFGSGWFGPKRQGGRRQQYPRLSSPRDQDFFAVVRQRGILVKLFHDFLRTDGFHTRRACRTNSSGSSRVNGGVGHPGLPKMAAGEDRDASSKGENDLGVGSRNGQRRRGK